MTKARKLLLLLALAAFLALLGVVGGMEPETIPLAGGVCGAMAALLALGGSLTGARVIDRTDEDREHKKTAARKEPETAARTKNQDHHTRRI